ncbi:MAG TPA: hypothetical protein VMV72_14660 [Verrucomicrobiae bacterium]|nr:hypothetical protein [Verrucomicrobiae bacterium]
MEGRSWVPTTCVLGAFAATFMALTVGSYTRKSATVDEPQHLTAGYTALRFHDYRIDPEHPPFLRMWAALPLLAMRDVQIDTNSAAWASANEWTFSHRFLYETNDADRLLYRARFMTVLLGVLLGVLVFSWARELFGFWTATAVLALYCVEPNILAHASLVTTDFGLACFAFGAAYFLWRATRRLTVGNIIGTVVFFSLAQISKFSALILGPIVIVLLAVHALRAAAWSCGFPAAGELRSRRSKILASLAILAVLALASLVAIWAAYGFRDKPITPNPDLLLLRDNPRFLEAAPVSTRVAGWLGKHGVVPDAYAQSLILSQVKAQHRTAYLAGRFSRTGWWYYFPAALVVKTPVTILMLLICGLALLGERRARTRVDAAFLVLPPAIFFGTAMLAHLNIGLRHILPIYPPALLIAGVTLNEIRTRWRAWLVLVPVVLAVIELATVYPDCLAFFNQMVGGPSNGPWILSDSNIDWGQDLKPLKKWMDARHVHEINLGYFGTADPAYYGIQWARLPAVIENCEPTLPRLRFPGYAAVSVQNLHGALHDAPAFYVPLLERKPVAVIGHSIQVYWVETNWWYTARP